MFVEKWMTHLFFNFFFHQLFSFSPFLLDRGHGTLVGGDLEEALGAAIS
jgi:hypothetical protein